MSTNEELLESSKLAQQILGISIPDEEAIAQCKELDPVSDKFMAENPDADMGNLLMHLVNHSFKETL